MLPNLWGLPEVTSPLTHSIPRFNDKIFRTLPMAPLKTTPPVSPPYRPFVLPPPRSTPQFSHSNAIPHCGSSETIIVSSSYSISILCGRFDTIALQNRWNWAENSPNYSRWNCFWNSESWYYFASVEFRNDYLFWMLGDVQRKRTKLKRRMSLVSLQTVIINIQAKLCRFKLCTYNRTWNLFGITFTCRWKIHNENCAECRKFSLPSAFVFLSYVRNTIVRKAQN